MTLQNNLIIALILVLSPSGFCLIYSYASSGNMKCSYGERGSLTATCVNATPNYFHTTPYRFDHLDETLRCVNCSLQIIESETFDISGNHIKNLDLSSSLIENIRQRAFVGLIFLERLILKSNAIKSIYPGTFTGVKKIHEIDLEFNQINLLNDDGFLELVNLERLTLRHNVIEKMTIHAFNGLTNLKELDLSSNLITDLSKVFQNLTTLQTIDLRYNKLQNFNGEEFANLTNLLDLNLARNQIITPAIKFSGPNSLLRLDLSFNVIKVINPGSFENLHALEQFDISNNFMTKVPRKSLQSFFNLRQLNMSYNLLTEFQTGTYSGLPQLRFLNLSHNKIESLEVTGVFSLQSLHTLDVSFNNISDLDYAALISRLPRLAYLELQNNMLPCDLESEMEVFFAEDNFKFILYGFENGAVKCVEGAQNVRRNKTLSQVAEAVALRQASGGSRGLEIFLVLAVCVLTLLIGILYFLQFRDRFQLPYLPRMSTSRVNLMPSDGGEDILR